MGKRIVWVVEGKGAGADWVPFESHEARSAAITQCRLNRRYEPSDTFKYRVVAYVPRDEK